MEILALGPCLAVIYLSQFSQDFTILNRHEQEQYEDFVLETPLLDHKFSKHGHNSTSLEGFSTRINDWFIVF